MAAQPQCGMSASRPSDAARMPPASAGSSVRGTARNRAPAVRLKKKDAPRTERRLHVRLTNDGQTLDFHVANPSYATGFPVWKAEPLPQSRTVNGVEITLRSLFAVAPSNPLSCSNWDVVPDVEFRVNGERIEDPVVQFVGISDPLDNTTQNTGIFSQPVWKVRIRFAPLRGNSGSGTQPFAAEFFVKPPAPPVGR